MNQIYIPENSDEIWLYAETEQKQSEQTIIDRRALELIF